MTFADFELQKPFSLVTLSSFNLFRKPYNSEIQSEHHQAESEGKEAKTEGGRKERMMKKEAGEVKVTEYTDVCETGAEMSHQFTWWDTCSPL